MIGRKLTLARKASGLTRSALAAATNIPLASVVAFETSKRLPDREEIAALASALEVSQAFLHDGHDIVLDHRSFRCVGPANAREKARLEVRALDHLTRRLAVERLLDLPPIEWQEPAKAPFDVADWDGVEEAATETRAAWGLGVRPAADLTRLLEDRGVKVLQIAEGSIEGLIAHLVIDGADAGRVLVVQRHGKTDRMRFTLAHELGHMLLRTRPSLDAERAVDRFAAAFLMPAGPFLAEISAQGEAPRIETLSDLGTRYGISLQALATRCRELAVVNEGGQTVLMRLASNRFAPPPAPETSDLFERMCRRALASGRIDAVGAAALLDMPVEGVDAFVAEGAVDAFAAYPFAVVRMATYQPADTLVPLLVFASVEMLTAERAEPVGTRRQSHAVVPGAGGGEVRFDRVAMRGREAAAWFADAGRGRASIPLPLNESDRRRGEHGVGVRAELLTHEPDWPGLALPLERDPLLDRDWSGQSAPFIGTGAAPARLNRLIAPADERLAALIEDRTATAFLERRLHVDLRQYPEYRGGMALIAPDPVVRNVRLSVPGRRPKAAARTLSSVSARARAPRSEVSDLP